MNNLLLDKLKVPEFDEKNEGAFRYWADCNSQEIIDAHQSFDEGRRWQHFYLTKEIEKRNRVIEKLIEQRNNRPQHNNMIPTQDYRKQEDQELLSIVEGV